MHVRIGWGRKFQIRGARFEKQTEPDVVRGRNGVKEDWFPLVSWECFVRFSFLQMSCGAVPKWHFCTIRASWRAHRCSMLDNRSSTSRGPTAHCQVAPAVQRIAFLHRPSKRFFCAADMVGTNPLRRHTQSRAELLKWKTGGELLRLADVMTGEAYQFSSDFPIQMVHVFSPWKLIIDDYSKKPSCVTVLLKYHCMSLPECQL